MSSKTKRSMIALLYDTVEAADAVNHVAPISPEAKAEACRRGLPCEEIDWMARAKDARLEAEEEQEDEHNTHAQYAHDD